MKVWITKYALKKVGIFECEGEVDQRHVEMIHASEDPYEKGGYFYGNEWHTSRKEAVKRAEEMRAKKIATLRKKIAKIEKLSFEAKE